MANPNFVQQVVASGSLGAVVGQTADQQSATLVSEFNPRYYQLAYQKKAFFAYCAAQATSVVGTGMVGLQVWNGSPAGTGGVNLVLGKCAGNIVVTSASTTSIVLATGSGQVGAPTGQTAATRTGNCYIGGVSSQGLALAAGTFTNAPTALWTLMHNTAAIGTTGEDPGFLIDFEGSIIIPPQYYVCLAAVGAAVAASGMNMSLTWYELPY